jgi:imidazolonepropionase-like amidohydrolase
MCNNADALIVRCSAAGSTPIFSPGTGRQPLLTCKAGSVRILGQARFLQFQFGPGFLAASILTLLSILSLRDARAETPDVDAPFAIRGARLVTVSGVTVERGTIVVDDGLIAAIGPDVEPPVGAWVIDGAGLVVYPGLIDGLAALPLALPPAPSGNEAPVSSGPGDRPGTTPWLRAADIFDPNGVVKWREAGFAAAAVAPRDGLVAGQAALVTLAGGKAGDAHDRGAAVVRDRVALRLDTRAGGPAWRGFPNSLMGVQAYLRQLFLDARHFLAASRRYEEDPLGLRRPAYDRALQPLAEMIEAGTPLLLPARSLPEIERAIELAAALGSRAIVHGGHEGYAAAGALQSAGAAVLISLDWPAAARDPDPEADETLRALRLRDRAPGTPEALRRAGVRFAFASEAIEDPGQALAAVEKAVAAGLPRDAAVRALTLDAAEILGVGDRLGSLEVGKIANLLVTEGELLVAGTRLDRMVIDGRIFDLDREAREAREGRSGEAATPAPSAEVVASVPAAPVESTPAVAERTGLPTAEPSTEPSTAEPSTAEPPTAEPPAIEATEVTAASTATVEGETGDAETPAAEGEERPAITLIRNATVLTVTDGEIANGEVLIRDGKIAAVGRDLRAPARARVIDAGGGYVMPGIVDCHSHIAIAGGVNESSVAVSSMAAIEQVLDPADPDIYRALAGGVTTANVLHGSANPIGGTNAVIKLRWGADAKGLLFAGAPPGIKIAMGENPKRSNASAPAGSERRYPATRMGVLDVIREAFTEARAYQAQWQRYELERKAAEKKKGSRPPIPPRRDLRLEPLVEVLEGKRLVHAHSYRADEILQLLRLAEELGFRIATLQHVLEGYRVADEIAAHGAGASTFSDRWAYKVEAWEAIPHNAALLTQRGVVASINSDSAEEMRHLNQEAAKAMKWGDLSENEALALVTLNPARQLGIADRVGSIEKGKDADLVIYDRHPLSVYAVVQQTLVDGAVVFDRALDLERRAAIDAEKKEIEERLARPADPEPEPPEPIDRERKPTGGAR